MAEKSSLECQHPSILYFEEDCFWRCMKCNENLIKCGINEFRLFCELSGKDPKTLMS